MRAPRLLAAFGLCALTGCASFSEIPERPTWEPPAGVTPPSVRLVLLEKYYVQPTSDWVEVPPHGLIEIPERAIRDSGWASVVEAADAAPLEVVLVTHQGRGPGLIPSLTGFLLPGKKDFRIMVKLSLSESGTTVSCMRTAETRTWYQTLLFVAYPFRPPGFRRFEATENMTLDCLAELVRPR